MYIYPFDRRDIIPFPIDRGRRDVPWTLPKPRQPFVPIVPFKEDKDDEYPVSKDEVENEAREKEDSLHESIMKNARRTLNKGLRGGKRIFPVTDIDPHIRNKEINMLISEYKAAGWKVEHKQKERPGDPTDGWNNLHFS